jgi:hypothetical protein
LNFDLLQILLNFFYVFPHMANNEIAFEVEIDLFGFDTNSYLNYFVFYLFFDFYND